jgi:ABC-2 type transport system ATP-binding protein
MVQPLTATTTEELMTQTLPHPEIKAPPRKVVVEVRNLSKTFGDVRAVRSASFKVYEGEVFGFFGPNGAGKTTAMRMLCGLLEPTSGEAVVAGYDIRSSPTRVRRSLAIIQEEEEYYEKMTVRAYLRFFSKLAAASTGRPKERFHMAVENAEIEELLGKKLKNLSHGQRQKVTIARALLSDVPIMFLDEPFQGIDIIHRKAMRAYLRRYVEAGGTVFFTSHNLIEAEHIVDRFAFIDKGQIIMVGTARELRDKYLLPMYSLRVSDPMRAQQVITQSLAVSDCQLKGEEVIVTLVNREDVPKMAVVLGGAGITMTEMKQLGTMEEVFLSFRRQKEGLI